MTALYGPNTPSASLTDLTVPTINLIEPTPIRPLHLNPSTATTSSPTLVASHRVLYRGSLSFVHSNSDIPLEGICIVAHFDHASPTRSALLSSPLPLALESQRGRSALNIISMIPTSSIEDRIDDSLDLRLYIHPQSLITHAYFERIFCIDNITKRGERTATCIRIRLSDQDDDSDDVVIYGQTSSSSSGSSSKSSAPSPFLNIKVARLLTQPVKLRPPARPRPDDPLPRSSRFPVPPTERTGLKRTASASFAVPSRPGSIDKPPLENRPNKLQRTLSASSKLPSRTTSSTDSTASSSRDTMSSAASTSASTGLVSAQALARVKGHARKKSSLSIVSTLLQVIDDDDDVFSSDLDNKVPRVSNSESSARVAQSKGLFDDAESGKSKAKVNGKVHKTPGKSLKTSASTGSLGESEVVVTTEENSLQLANRETIKRVAVSMLAQRGYPKTHDEFKELYSISIRGTSFALRHLMNERRIEREEARAILQIHLDMYILGGGDLTSASAPVSGSGPGFASAPSHDMFYPPPIH